MSAASSPLARVRSRSGRGAVLTGPGLLGAAGVGMLAGAWLGPLPSWTRSSFAAHMTLHMAVVAVGAPLLALALAGSRRDPVRSRPHLFSPVPVAALELVVVWGWHAPALHHAARASAPVMALEQASFLAVGLLLWLSAFGGPPGARRDRAGAGAIGLLLTSMHMTLLGALLGLATRPLYHADRAGLDSWGLGPLESQQAGGAIMLIVGGAVYLAGGLVLAARLTHARAERAT